MIDHRAATRPSWPTDEIDLRRVDVDDDPPADELTLFYGGQPVPSVSRFLTEPGFEDVAILVDDATDQIVGIQAIPFLVGAVHHHPCWAVLAWASLTDRKWEAEMVNAAISAAIADIRATLDHAKPPPPTPPPAKPERLVAGS